MPARLRSAIGLLLGLCWCCAAPAAEQCRPREATTAFGRWFTPSLALDARHWSVPVQHGLTGITPTSFRLLLAVDAGVTDRDWTVVLRDEKMRVLASLGPSDFADGSQALTQRRWTGRLPALSVQADLIASPASDAIVRVIEGLAYPDASANVQLFSIQGATAAWHPLYDTGDAGPKRAGDAVGMLLTGTESADGGDKASWCCSGVMLSSDLMLTNWHCGGTAAIPDAAYWNADIRDNTLVDLSWDGGSVRRQYSGVEVVAKDRDLDFAVIRVRPVVGLGGGEATRARIAARPVAEGDPIFVIHHAQCQPKLLSTRCQVRSAHFRTWTTDPATAPAGGGPDFTHDCDTEPGASGAAVFDARGFLVGLHHLGFEKSAQCGLDRVNKAVRIEAIIARLRADHPEVVGALRLEAPSGGGP